MSLQGKRLFDLSVAGLAAAVLSPSIAVIAILIRIRDGSPVIYAQKRVGRRGREFRIYKFRTMRNDKAGLSVSAADDDRITALGRHLRRAKLDELPQLWNVLLGDMSLVGPRPEVPEFVSLWTEEDRSTILSIRPGITDPASLKFRNEGDILATAKDPRDYYIRVLLPEKCALYREYVRGRTFSGDLQIGIRTFMAVIFGSRSASSGTSSGGVA